MQKKTTKKIAVFLASVLAVASFSACDFLKNLGGNEQASSVAETEDGFTLLYNEAKTSSLKRGDEVEIPLNKEIAGKNYLRIRLNTAVNLVGYVEYTDKSNSAKSHCEKIHIERGETEFTAFLDAFRLGARGDFDKILTKITLKSVSETEGNVRIKEVAVSDRTYPEGMLYIQNDSLKIGVDLTAGGALCHVERLGRQVVEYIDEKGCVRIDEGVDASAVNCITDEVNLVNIHDLGREIQQSYYAGVGEENGYVPDEEVLYDGLGGDVLYNPVQAGSAGDK